MLTFKSLLFIHNPSDRKDPWTNGNIPNLLAEKLTSSPCTGTIGNEVTKKSSYPSAHKDIWAWQYFLVPAFSKIKKEKTRQRTYEYCNKGSPPLSWTVKFFESVGFGFYLKFFKFHACIYVYIYMQIYKYIP